MACGFKGGALPPEAGLECGIATAWMANADVLRKAGFVGDSTPGLSA